jgi:octaprenyl-diphosphate synthase
MSQAVNDRVAGRQWLDLLYEPIREDLAKFEDLLRAELRSDYPLVDQLAKHGFRLGGKRLRPALLLLSAKAAGGVKHEHLVLAVVVEMIHTATLVHDDVLDAASLRRHLETVNARWGGQASVLLGDFLFTHAFYLASTLSSTFACQTIGRATNIVCEGELRQIASSGNLALGEQEYLGIIEAKTAELCACCCQLGARYADADGAVEAALARYGRGLGIAFQIVDDLLDLIGDEATTGKSLGTDLEQQKLTLPLIRLLAQLDDARRREAVRVLQGADDLRREALEGWLQDSDALTYSRHKAVEYAQQARSELDCLAPSAAKSVLSQLTEFVVERRQ